MKVKVRTFFLSFLVLFLIMGIVPQAQAEFAYFVQDLPLAISYETSTNSASGSNILMQNFTAGTTTYIGSIFSFSFVNGSGTMQITQGTNVIFSGNISNAEIIPIIIGGQLRYYQIAGNVLPSTVGSPVEWFDFGQINVTFLPNSNYTGGYFQFSGESKTPIPGAVWLLGTGLFGLIAIRRRKKS